VVTDVAGNLYVAETGNNRVIRFNNAKTKANGAAGDIVIGQAGFGTSATGAGAAAMNQPFSVALDTFNRLFVGDSSNNRVQIFTLTTFTNGQSAALTIGQTSTSGNASTSPPTANSLSFPGGILFNAPQNAIYVADFSNNRVVAYCFASATPSVSLTGSNTVSNSATVSLTNTPTLSSSGTVSVTASVSVTTTATWTVSPSNTWTNTPTYSSTVSGSNTLTPTSTRTSKPTLSATRPPSASQTALPPPPPSPMTKSNTFVPPASSQPAQQSIPVAVSSSQAHASFVPGSASVSAALTSLIPGSSLPASVSAASTPTKAVNPSTTRTAVASGNASVCREQCYVAFVLCKQSLGRAVRKCRLSKEACVAKCAHIFPSRA